MKNKAELVDLEIRIAKLTRDLDDFTMQNTTDLGQWKTRSSERKAHSIRYNIDKLDFEYDALSN